MSNAVKFITENFDKYTPTSIESYEALTNFKAMDKAFELGSDEVIDIMKISGIRGRGGAEYDTARKWSQAREVKGDDKVIICNADEGEPCTFKDREILTKDPFRLIEGMIICAFTVGAKRGYIYIREEYRYLQKLMKNVISQCYEKGILGENIHGSGMDFDIYVYSGAGAYVCGEGSTLIESIEGKSGRPRIKPPFIKQAGLWMLPTCVNNVETLASACAILQNGIDEYMKYGTERSPGAKIICLAGNVEKPGAYEVPFGITLKEIIYDIGGGIPGGHELKFMQLGGASGRICPASRVDTPYTYDDLKNIDMTVGSGGFLVVDDRTRVIDFVKGIQDFFIHESCGKCTPCREGNRQISKIVDRMVEGEALENDIETGERFAQIMKNCAFCGLGETAQSVMLSALNYYRDEFDSYIYENRKGAM